MFIACKEFWYDNIVRVYSKRKVGVNSEDISSYFEHYDTEMKKTVLRVCLKNGRYHDIEGDFDTFHDTVSNCSENMRGEKDEYEG